jgi:hypothetical protein
MHLSVVASSIPTVDTKYPSETAEKVPLVRCQKGILKNLNT